MTISAQIVFIGLAIGLTYSLLANTITIHWAGLVTPPPGTSYSAVFDIGSAAAVPEPATWALMLLGFGAVGWQLRRRRSQVFAQAI